MHILYYLHIPKNEIDHLEYGPWENLEIDG